MEHLLCWSNHGLVWVAFRRKWMLFSRSFSLHFTQFSAIRSLLTWQILVHLCWQNLVYRLIVLINSYYDINIVQFVMRNLYTYTHHHHVIPMVNNMNALFIYSPSSSYSHWIHFILFMISWTQTHHTQSTQMLRHMEPHKASTGRLQLVRQPRDCSDMGERQQ